MGVEEEMATTQLLEVQTLTDDVLPENAQRIMSAALRLFSTKGYSATSVREIVHAAKVTNPMLYYYFDSKRGLFEALTEGIHSVFHERLSLALASAEDLESQLHEVVWAHLEGVREDPVILRFVYSILFGPSESYPEHRMYERHTVIVEEIASAFDSAVARGEFEPRGGWSSEALAQQLLGLINSHLMRVLKELEHAGPRAERTILDQHASEDAVEPLVDFFLAAAGTVNR